MGIKKRFRSIPGFRLSACGLVAIFLYGCAAPQSAYRKIYGPGPWDWDDRGDYFDRPFLQERTVPRVEAFPPGTGHPFLDPKENLGRPEPPPTEIPGISDIPEIPDEPTVLPE